MRLDQRILNLERIAEDAEQRQEVREAEESGQPVIIFNIVDASIAEE